jgi:hypothetical protein
LKVAVFWTVALCSLEKFTDVSGELAASIIRVIARLRDPTTQKTAIFVLAA